MAEKPPEKKKMPLYPLRSQSKLNYVPESMAPNAKSLVESGYFVTTSPRIDKKREKIGLEAKKESIKDIEQLVKESRLRKLVGVDK